MTKTKPARALYAIPRTFCLILETAGVKNTNTKNMVLLTSLILHSLHVLAIIVYADDW